MGCKPLSAQTELRKQFICKKENQHFCSSATPTIDTLARLLPQAPGINVFLLLFQQKKKILPYFIIRNTASAAKTPSAVATPLTKLPQTISVSVSRNVHTLRVA